MQDERDQDDRHFPEKIYQTERLPFSCDLLKPQEIRLSGAVSCCSLTFLLKVPEMFANVMLWEKELSKRKNKTHKQKNEDDVWMRTSGF